MSVRGFINIDIDTWNRKKRASVCYAGRCGSMQSTIKWARRYVKKDTDFALEVLNLAMKEEEKVRNVITRFNRRFG